MSRRSRVQPAQLALNRPGHVAVPDVPEPTRQRASVRQLEAARGSSQPMVHDRLRLGDAHPLDRHRHHDTGQARARLAHDQRVHRCTGSGHLGGQVGEPGGQAGRGRVAAELGPEPGVDQEALDQLGRERAVAISG
jgi:hypothetical protein